MLRLVLAAAVLLTVASLAAAAPNGNVVTLEAKVFVKIYDDLGWRPGYLWACDPKKAGSCKKSDPNSDIRREARGYCIYGAGRLIADKKNYAAEAPDPGTTTVTKQGDAWVVGYNGFVSSQAGATVFKTINCLKTLPTSPPPQQPPPPSPQPKPSPKPKPAGQLGIDYKLPERFGKRNPNGTIHYPEGKELDPDEFEVELEVRRKDKKGCVDGDVAAVTVNGKPLLPSRLKRDPDAPCLLRALFSKEGTYDVRVRLKTKAGPTLAGQRTVVVQDWLIVGLGDSNGSGEGTPDRITPTPGRNPNLAKWQSRKCDRSANSYQAQTALELEERDPRTSVTFLHLACSGASIFKGLIGQYEGITGGALLAPQVDEMERLASGREIDAVLISIGINDLGFAELVKQCISKEGCASSPFPKSTSSTTLDEVMRERLASLRLSYKLLAEALSQAGVPASHVYITEYFDSTHRTDDKESFCNPLIGTPAGSFSRAEAKWAYTSILQPLNAAVTKAAGDYKWRLVSGAAERFRPHGYCADEPWIVGLVESLSRQGNANGTLHATAKGNAIQAEINVPKIRADFYKNDRTRRPKR